MKRYKLITRDRKTRRGCTNETEWPIGKWIKAIGKGTNLCSDGYLHCYDDPYLALFLNPIHAGIDNPIVCEVRAGGRSIKDGPLKRGYKEMMVVRDLDISVTRTQRVAFAILCALEVYKEDTFVAWAKAWLSGKDRSARSARSTRSEAESAIWAVESARSAARSTRSAAARSAIWAVESIELAAWSARSAVESIESAESAWSARSAARSAAQSAARSAQNKFLKQLIKKYNRSTIDVKLLRPDEIFIFGSNEAGKHDAGAAKLAKDKFKAKYGVGEGLTGKCYAFPTLDKDFKKLSVYKLKKSVNKLNKCAKDNPFKIFLLTKVGCGIAGYNEKEISNLFKNIELNIIKPEGW